MSFSPDSTQEIEVQDALGSTKGLVVMTKDLSTTVKTFDYKPYGDTLRTLANLPDDAYIGMELDGERGQYHFNARSYDQKLSRFFAPDLLFEQTPNQSPYSYSNNSPINFKDPSGLKAENFSNSNMDVYVAPPTGIDENRWAWESGRFGELAGYFALRIRSSGFAFSIGGGGGSANSTSIKKTKEGDSKTENGNYFQFVQGKWIRGIMIAAQRISESLPYVKNYFSNNESELKTFGGGVSYSLNCGGGYIFSAKYMRVDGENLLDFSMDAAIGYDVKNLTGYGILGFSDKNNTINMNDYINSNEYFGFGAGMVRSGYYSAGFGLYDINHYSYREYSLGYGTPGFGFSLTHTILSFHFKF